MRAAEGAAARTGAFEQSASGGRRGAPGAAEEALAAATRAAAPAMPGAAATPALSLRNSTVRPSKPGRINDAALSGGGAAAAAAAAVEAAEATEGGTEGATAAAEGATAAAEGATAAGSEHSDRRAARAHAKARPAVPRGRRGLSPEAASTKRRVPPHACSPGTSGVKSSHVPAASFHQCRSASRDGPSQGAAAPSIFCPAAATSTMRKPLTTCGSRAGARC